MDLKCLLEEGKSDHFKSFSIVNEGFPGGTCGKDVACQFRDTEMQFQSLGWEDPLEKEMAIHSNILA